MILSYNLSTCLLVHRCSVEQILCHVLERLRLLSYFHQEGTIACAWDLIKSQSEEANKVSGGRLLQLSLLTSPLRTNLWDSPWHAFIHCLPLKHKIAAPRQPIDPGLFPPASHIINTTPGVPERLRRLDGRLTVRRGMNAGISSDQRTFRSSPWSHSYFLF